MKMPVTAPPAPATSTALGGDRPAARSIADVERDAIQAALKQVDGNRRRAAELLGIGLRTLYDKLKLYQIEG